MQSFAVFVALIAAASATVVYQYPGQSAVINSQRLGGNFAYNVAEQGQAVYGIQSPSVYSYAASPVAQTTSLVGASGVVQNVQYKNGQQLTYQAQAVPAQTYQSVYNQQVLRSPVVAQTYSVPAQSIVAAGTPANTYRTVAGVSPINYGSVYGLQYGQQVQYV